MRQPLLSAQELKSNKHDEFRVQILSILKDPCRITHDRKSPPITTSVTATRMSSVLSRGANGTLTSHTPASRPYTILQVSSLVSSRPGQRLL